MRTDPSPKNCWYLCWYKLFHQTIYLCTSIIYVYYLAPLLLQNERGVSAASNHRLRAPAPSVVEPRFTVSAAALITVTTDCVAQRLPQRIKPGIVVPPM